MSTKIGRNDPCPCGSGKKYKLCHLALDEQRKPVHYQTPESVDSPSAPPRPGRVFNLLRQMRRVSRPGHERAELDRLLAQTQPVIAYCERLEEIEAAALVLAAHKEKFIRLAADEVAYVQRAHSLFAEERFVPLRFTAADVRRAFDRVGYPPNGLDRDEALEKLRSAIVFLADKDHRSQLSMNMLLHLPHYVAAGRHLDGWLIQHLAHQTMPENQECNLFLFEMFSYGYNAWADEQRARNEAMLRKIGMDPARLGTMSMEEIDSWMMAQQADPRQKARMEAVIKANPDQQALAIASIKQMERDSINLLEREDAREFLLSPAELEPWLPTLLQCFESAQNKSLGLFSNTPPDQATANAFINAIRPVLGEMARSIFTPKRIQQLVAQLKKYRNELFAAGDKDAAGCAIGAITSLERENEPALNCFLNALCFVSLRTLEATRADPGSRNEDAAPRADPAT